MPNLDLYFYVIVFVGGLSFSEALFLILSRGDRSNQERAAEDQLKKHASRLQTKTEEEIQSIFIENQSAGPILRMLMRLIPDRRPLDLVLYRAGIRMPLETFVGISLLLAILGFLLGNSVLQNGYVTLSAPLLAALPYLYARRKMNQRMALFMNQLPEAVSLLCRSLKAGHPFRSGMALAAEEMDAPVSEEFGQAVEEMALGLDPRVALQNLSMRMNTPDMPFFVTAILIQRETGGDLPAVLENLAKTMRDRMRFEKKVKALTSQTMTSANTLALFPTLFVIFLSYVTPGYLDPLFETTTGTFILRAAAGLNFVGWILCRQMAVVKL